MTLTQNTDKMKSDDRILILEPMEGRDPRDTRGLIDKRLFQGGNRLHAHKHPETGLWCFKYEIGGVPEALKQQFTSFNMLMKYATGYFETRNIKVTKVED